MIRKLLTILAILSLTASVTMAQWEGGEAWPDTSYKGGTHGIAVDPDGKVWQSSYYNSDWITPDGDTLKTSPIFVFNADGTIFDTIYTVTSGTVIDTLTGNCRGMGVDENGNIVFVKSGPSTVIKINYSTLEGMGSRVIGDDLGTSPTAPSVDDNGNIFIGPVVGGGTNAIAMYDTDLTYLGNAVVGPPAIGRTMEVSPDGNTIYWMPFTATKTFVYTRADEFSAYELTDSIHIGMSIESSAWQPGTGLLWVSNDSRGPDSTKSHLTWYGYDVVAKTFVDSFSLTPTGLGDEFPRGLDFSPDGSIAYVGLFGTAFERVFKFTTGPIEPPLIAVDGEKDAFFDGLTGPDDGYLQMRYFVSNANGEADDDADLSAKIWFAWDEAWLYAYAEVMDDIILNTSVNAYQNDIIELKIDPVPTEAANSIVSLDLTALDAGTGVANIGAVADDASKKYARKTMDGGYVLELGVKWDAIVSGEEVITPALDGVFGLAINFHDNDATTREASIEWAAVMDDNVWNTPASLGTVKFLADNKMQMIPTNNFTPENTNDLPYDGSDIVAVEAIEGLPTEYSLTQNYPNPFNPTTVIDFAIPKTGTVSLKIYDMLGQEIATLLNGEQTAGTYKVTFDASQLASGTYIYSLKAGDFQQSKKMTLLK